MNKALSFFWEVIKVVVLALVIVIPIRYFVFQPFIVNGISMEPNFHNGDYLIIDELTYRFREPQRGEVIVFYSPQNPTERYIKRIIGLPGEKVEIENNIIEITEASGQEVVLDEFLYLQGLSWSGDIELALMEDEYFVLGDNRPHSFDSRKWGALERKYIIGRALLRAWPLTDLGFIPSVSY